MRSLIWSQAEILIGRNPNDPMENFFNEVSRELNQRKLFITRVMVNNQDVSDQLLEIGERKVSEVNLIEIQFADLGELVEQTRISLIDFIPIVNNQIKHLIPILRFTEPEKENPQYLALIDNCQSIVNSLVVLEGHLWINGEKVNEKPQWNSMVEKLRVVICDLLLKRESGDIIALADAIEFELPICLSEFLRFLSGAHLEIECHTLDL